MSETNINAFKEELVVAERNLDRAKSRVEELKRHIEAVEPSEVPEVKEPIVDDTDVPADSPETAKKKGKK